MPRPRRDTTPPKPRRHSPSELSPEEKLKAGVLGDAKDAAHLLNVSPGVVYRKWRSLRGVRRVGKHLRFNLRELLE